MIDLNHNAKKNQTIKSAKNIMDQNKYLIFIARNVIVIIILIKVTKDKSIIKH